MSVQKLATLLGATGELQAIGARTRRVATWQRRYERAVPPALARASQVAGVRSGTLILWADNAAVAAKLKQLAPRLAAAVGDEREPVTTVRVLVQPGAAVQAAARTREGRGLPPCAVEKFERLSATMPDSPLKAAVTALVARHRQRR